MKKILFSLVCLSFLFTVGTVSAQKELTKEEKKEWKKTAKEYVRNPAALARLTKDKQELQRINNTLESDMNLMKTQVNAKDNRIASLESELDQLSLELDAARSAPPPLEPAYTPTETGEMIPMGTIYRVQIGAYKSAKNQIPVDLETGKDLGLEQTDGLQKILLGQFTDKASADELRKHLKKMGLKDAWVVTYVDGIRQ